MVVELSLSSCFSLSSVVATCSLPESAALFILAASDLEALQRLQNACLATEQSPTYIPKSLAFADPKADDHLPRDVSGALMLGCLSLGMS